MASALQYLVPAPRSNGSACVLPPPDFKFRRCPLNSALRGKGEQQEGRGASTQLCSHGEQQGYASARRHLGAMATEGVRENDGVLQGGCAREMEMCSPGDDPARSEADRTHTHTQTNTRARARAGGRLFAPESCVQTSSAHFADSDARPLPCDPFRSRHAAAYELSKILDTGLDKETLSVLVALCENGVNPEVSEADSDADASPARD